MSIVAAVKEAVRCGTGDTWALNLPGKEQDAHYRSLTQFDHERRDFLEMKIAGLMSQNDGYRGGIFKPEK